MRIAFEPTSFLHAWMIIQPPDDPSLKKEAVRVVTSQHPGWLPVIPSHNTPSVCLLSRSLVGGPDVRISGKQCCALCMYAVCMGHFFPRHGSLHCPYPFETKVPCPREPPMEKQPAFGHWMPVQLEISTPFLPFQILLYGSLVHAAYLFRCCWSCR
jgi:hypothetical protein